ncbi:hypothetical protein LZ554_002828 [Drepanopeziza brunnea f. sp. 'monogermtubi']|nr:hypothetical protein LZ554_002828 [Drepanopeziza brunnea f. sp. 'monogermtubi']
MHIGHHDQDCILANANGKGFLPGSQSSNAASARSAALKGADIFLALGALGALGARLNWILHHGEEPKWNAAVKIVQVDVSAKELGKNNADPALDILGDIKVMASQPSQALADRQYTNLRTLFR